MTTCQYAGGPAMASSPPAPLIWLCERESGVLKDPPYTVLGQGVWWPGSEGSKGDNYSTGVSHLHSHHQDQSIVVCHSHNASPSSTAGSLSEQKRSLLLGLLSAEGLRQYNSGLSTEDMSLEETKRCARSRAEQLRRELSALECALAGPEDPMDTSDSDCEVCNEQHDVEVASAGPAGICDLPVEVVGLILDHLDTVSLFQAKSSCKHLAQAFTHTLTVAALGYRPRPNSDLKEIADWNAGGCLEDKISADLDKCLSGCAERCYWVLNAVAQCPQLRQVHAENLFVTDRALWSLVQCRQLKSLNLRGCPSMSSAGLGVVLGQLTQLEELDVSGCDIGDEAFAHLSSTHRLRAVSVRDCRITNVALARLARCPELRSLDIWARPIRGVYRVGDAGLCSLAVCSKLVTLKLGWSNTQDSGVAALAAGCNNLQELDLTHTAVGTEGLRAIVANCRDLRRLTLFECRNVSDSSMTEAICFMSNLEELNVGCTNVTDKGLENLSNLGKLHSLDLSACKITDTGLFCVARCASVHSLSIIGLQGVSDRGLHVVLDSLPLRYLSIAFCGRITDDSLGAIPKCCNLQWLELGPNVSVKAMRGLADCKSLAAVYCLESSCASHWVSADARMHLEQHGIDVVQQKSDLCVCSSVWGNHSLSARAS